MRLVPLVFFLTISVAAARPIEIEYSRGRNPIPIKLVDQAQDQLFKANDVSGAHKSVDAAIKADPTFWPAFYIRAQVLMREHHYEAALQDCETILRQDSTVVEAALVRAEANYHLGRCAASMKEVENCIVIRPRLDALARAYDMRARLRLYCSDPSIRNPKKAIADATMACKLMAWSDGELIDTLAAAEAVTGNFEAAIHHEQQAMGAKEVRDDEKRDYEKHLAAFQQHKTGSASASH